MENDGKSVDDQMDIENIDNPKKKIMLLREKLKVIFYDESAKNEKIAQVMKDGFREVVEWPWYMVMPTAKWKLIWDIVLNSITFYNLFFLPIDVGLSKQCLMNSSVLNIINVLDLSITILNFVDIIFNILTPFTNKKGNLVFNLKEIFIAYLKSSFIFDLLGSIPWNFLMYSNSNCVDAKDISTNFIMFLGLLRVRRIASLNHLIEESNSKYLNIFRLMKLLLAFFYVCHFFGCIVVGVTTKISTLSSQLMNPCWDSFIFIYSYSLMTGINLMLGTDLNITEPSQQVVVILFNILSLAMTANIFGYVAMILEKINTSKVTNSKNLITKLDLINEYLLYEDVNASLRMEINEFYKFMYIRERMLFEENMYQDINPILLSNVKFELWKNAFFVKDTLFVRNIISPFFFSRCLEVMKGRIFKKGDIIIEEGESSIDLYLICTSSVCDVFCSGLLMNSMKEGEFFGETAVFTSSKKRTSTVISKTDGDYLIIPGKAFYTLILDFEEERSLFLNYAMKYLTLYNKILTPQQFGLFISKKDKVFKSVLQKNLYKNPPVQSNVLFYRRNFDDNEYLGNELIKHNFKRNKTGKVDESVDELELE
jgi:hypothetical protein